MTTPDKQKPAPLMPTPSDPTPARPPTTPPAQTRRPTTQAAPVAPVKTQIDHEAIARRAYEISLSGQGGSEDDNWFQAERELRGMD